MRYIWKLLEMEVESIYLLLDEYNKYWKFILELSKNQLNQNLHPNYECLDGDITFISYDDTKSFGFYFIDIKPKYKLKYYFTKLLNYIIKDIMYNWDKVVIYAMVYTIEYFITKYEKLRIKFYDQGGNAV